jgi:hypothetical protein
MNSRSSCGLECHSGQEILIPPRDFVDTQFSCFRVMVICQALRYRVLLEQTKESRETRVEIENAAICWFTQGLEEICTFT